MSALNAKTDSKSYPEWRDLPVVLLAGVSKHVTSIQDFLSFRGVCSSWRSAATFANFEGAIPRVPWLMCVSIEEEKKESEGNSDSDDKKVVVSGEEGKRESEGNTESDGRKVVLSLFDLYTKKACILNNVNPKAGERYLSCGGWVLCVSESNGRVYLTHPVWPIKIGLPNLDTFPGYNKREKGVGYFKKMVLSGSPTRKLDLVVMVIWGNLKLGFSRPGDFSWTVMGMPSYSFCDILYHSRRLYAVDSSKRVIEFDIHGPNPGQILQVFPLPSNNEVNDNEDDALPNPIPQNNPLFMANARYIFIHYLVESSGKLLIVSRVIKGYRTSRFQILEVDLRDGSHKEIKHLGKRALFLGFNSSLCLELPDSGVVKPNHVYLPDNHSGRIKYLDMGVSRLKDLFPWELPHGCSGTSLAPPTWVVPSI